MMKMNRRVGLLLLGVAVVYSAGSGAQTLSEALSSGETLALRAGVSGQVAAVLVKPGEQVSKGQLLLQLDDATYQSRLKARLAVLEYAALNLKLLEEDYARQQELYDEGSLSTVELQQLDLGVKQARSEWAVASAKLAVITEKLANTKIIAPLAGEIIAVPLVGQRVSINAGLPTLIQLKPDRLLSRH
jgi:RND family efflux transporter MFP subunit